MLSLFYTHGKQIFTGNILFIVCCIFYLAWWLLAFNPSGAITGIKTSWLLIPASISGLLGVVQALRGILVKLPANQLLPGKAILWGGLALYIILLAVTVRLFKRPVTSELFLIVGWCMLALAEINALFGFGLFSQKRSIVFILAICVAAVVSLICYVLYYRLDKHEGYIDGMIPLILAALTITGISCFLLMELRNPA